MPRAALKAIVKRALGAGWAAVRRGRMPGTVFAYHDVSPEPSRFLDDNGLRLTPRAFEDSLAWITRHFRIVSPERLATGEPLADNEAVLTFDDGFAGTFEHALPILGRHGLPALILLNMGPVDTGEPLVAAQSARWADEDEAFRAFLADRGITGPAALSMTPQLLAAFRAEWTDRAADTHVAYQGRFATLEQVVAWDGQPGVFYGNHQYQHWNSAVLDGADFEDQYRRNEERLRSFASHLPVFAFPFGVPDLCYAPRHVERLLGWGARTILSGVGTIPPGFGGRLIPRAPVLPGEPLGYYTFRAAGWWS